MRRLILFALPLALFACADTENPEETNNNEVITTVALVFTPMSGGSALEFAWADPEYDGSPVIDDIVLADGEQYTLTVSFLNELESPPEDITEEVDAESDQHQVFFTGTGIEGPSTGDNAAAVATLAYDDIDSNGLPVGLSTIVTSVQVGEGTLTVTLRHLPLENGVAVKEDGLAEQVAGQGLASLPGDTDAEVTFNITVE